MKQKMNEIQKKLFEHSDKEYASFQIKLTPGITDEDVIGVRVPVVRKLAKEILKEGFPHEFISSLPHRYYDENMLHGLLISEIKDFDEAVKAVDDFLPYVDNWAVCDIMSPKIFRKNKEKLIDYIVKWSCSERTYTCRFGIEMLMSHFLDGDFKKEYLEIPAKVVSDEYYVMMMKAWFFATALAKQWDSTIPYITENRLDTQTHNKTIQKSVESFRITPEQKDYLKQLKIKVKST